LNFRDITLFHPKEKKHNNVGEEERCRHSGGIDGKEKPISFEDREKVGNLKNRRPSVKAKPQNPVERG